MLRCTILYIYIRTDNCYLSGDSLLISVLIYARGPFSIAFPRVSFITQRPCLRHVVFHDM